MIPSAVAGSVSNAQQRTGQDQKLMEVAQKLEANFLAEMLKAAGLGEPIEGWSGGAGEEQFASFLRQAQADEMARTGGVGLAESIYQALKERTDV